MGSEVLSKKSRTGVIKIGPDWCEKKLDRGRDFDAEIRSVKKLVKLFGEGVVYDGWKYQSVRVLQVDQANRSIIMTRARGDPLTVTPSAENAFLAGVWLSRFHDAGPVKSRCPLFGDFGPSHLFIDWEGRTVTAIDPGAQCGKSEYPEVDVGYMLSCLVLLGLKRRTSPIRLGRSFLKGYFSPGPAALDRARLMEAIKAERMQTYRRWVRKRDGWRSIVLGVLARAYWAVNRLCVSAIIWDLRRG